MSGREDPAPERGPEPEPTPEATPEPTSAEAAPATPDSTGTAPATPKTADAGGQAPPATQPGPRNGFWKGLSWFLAPVALLAVGSMAGQDVVVLWFVAVLFLLVALIGAVVFHVRRRDDIGNGALTALALGVVILFGTCVYNLSHNL